MRADWPRGGGTCRAGRAPRPRTRARVWPSHATRISTGQLRGFRSNSRRQVSRLPHVHRLRLVRLLERPSLARAVQLAVDGDPVAARREPAELRLARHQVVFGARRDLGLARPRARRRRARLRRGLRARERDGEAAAQVVGVGDADHEVAVAARGARRDQRDREREQPREQPAPARRIRVAKSRSATQARLPRLGREARRSSARAPPRGAAPSAPSSAAVERARRAGSRASRSPNEGGCGRRGRDVRPDGAAACCCRRRSLADQLLDARGVGVVGRGRAVVGVELVPASRVALRSVSSAESSAPRRLGVGARRARRGRGEKQRRRARRSRRSCRGRDTHRVAETLRCRGAFD